MTSPSETQPLLLKILDTLAIGFILSLAYAALALTAAAIVIALGYLLHTGWNLA